MRLSTRLALAMVALVLLTATAVSLLTYRNVVAIALPHALDRIDTHARVVATLLDASTRGARADVNTQGKALEWLVSAIIAGGVHPLDGTHAAEWQARLASRFVAELTAKPSYSRFRLIGIADGGREIVRVDRLGPAGAIRVVPDTELQRQGDQDYFKATIGLSINEVFASAVDLSKTQGAIETPYTPTIRIAAPIFAPDGRPFGIMIVNIDLRAAFDRVRSAALAGGHVYVVSEFGDYLVHADRDREFGFEFGKPARIQDDFPDFAGLLAKEHSTPLVMADRTGALFGMGWGSFRLAGGPKVTVVETQPYAQVMGAATTIRDSSLVGGLAAILCAIVLAVVLARSLTRPLVQMTKAVKGFSQDGSIAAPVSGGGLEISVLGAAFANMASESQHKTEALKQEIEERRLIFDSSPDLIVVTDRQGTLARVSPSSEAILGYRPEEMIGQSAAEFVFSDDLDPTREEMRSAHRGRIIHNFEARNVHKDGRVVVLGWAGVWSEATQQHFFIGRDMTAQKLAEDKFRLAVEASPSGLVMIDESGAIVLINAETERLFGYQRHEMIGRSIDMLVPERLRGHHRRHRSGFAARPETRRMGAGRDLYGLRKNGTEFPVEIGLNPIQTPAGLLVMSVIVDITESKKAQEALHESERTARAIIETALDAFVQLDETGTIIDWSPKSETMFGWSRQEVIGQKLRDLIIPTANRAAHSERIAKFLRDSENGTPGRRYEVPSLRRDGSEIKTEVSLTALRRHDGYVINKFIRDITEQKAAEEQLRRAQKMESVGQLTGGIAHDFNNMLTVILGNAELLTEGLNDKPELRALAQLTLDAADRSATLTQRLLAFGRQQSLESRETNINELLAQMVELMRSALGEHVKIELRQDPDLWTTKIDRGQFEAAALNLGVNARDAMPEGGTLTIQTANTTLDEDYAALNPGVSPGEYVGIIVSDTGTGMKPDVLPRVFEPFFTTKEVGKGTGLGLSMIYGFVKQSGGHVTIYSELGMGTTVRLYFPRCDAPSIVPDLKEYTESTIPAGNETILLVEDNPLVRAHTERQLVALGYRVVTAEKAQQALELLGSLEPDLLFTDIVMPGGMNGRELADEARRRIPHLKILFTSGYAQGTPIQKEMTGPSINFIGKPYRRAELAARIRETLEGKTLAASFALEG